MLRLLRLDALALLRDRLAVAALVIGSLTCLIAVVVGHAWVERLGRDAAAVALTASTERNAARNTWAEAATLPPAEAVLTPGGTRLSVPLGRPLLPDFTAGRSAYEPTAANIRMSTRPDALFVRYQVENPERLARGVFDLSLVAVVLAPLLLIGLGYGVFVADRDSGTARLWLAQAGSPLRLLAVRSLNRLALVALPLAIATIVLLSIGPDVPGRGGAAALWLGVAVIGLLFWWAVILLVNAFRITAETSALILVGIWASLVFVIPVATASAASLLNPPPSRFEQIAAARSVEVRASRDFDNDHPDLSATTLEGRRTLVTKGVGIRRDVAAAVAPLARAYDDRIAAQQTLLRRLAILSPSVMTADALAAISRTDLAFYLGQRRGAIAHLNAFGATMTAVALGERPVDAATFDTVPRFAKLPDDPAGLTSAALLLFVSMAILAGAVMRLRRIQPL